MRKPSLHEEQDNPRWRTRFLHRREHPPLRAEGIGEPVHGVWADTMNSRILRLRVEAGSQSCMTNPPTHALTHLPTYPHTKARKQTARELHANCVRARTPESEDENESEVERECQSEGGKAITTATATAAGPLAASCFSLVAGRQSLPAASRQSENDNVMCSVKQNIFVISSVFLSVASALAGRENDLPN